MKTLTLILALACSAQAQLITVGDWKDYKAECWKDSTKHVSKGLMIRNETGKWYLAEGDFYSYPSDAETRTVITATYYTHRTPTFEGFMEWMERRPVKEWDIRDFQTPYFKLPSYHPAYYPDPMKIDDLMDSTMIITIPRKPPHVFDIRDVQVGYSLDSTMQIITIPRKP